MAARHLDESSTAQDSAGSAGSQAARAIMVTLTSAMLLVAGLQLKYRLPRNEIRTGQHASTDVR